MNEYYDISQMTNREVMDLLERQKKEQWDSLRPSMDKIRDDIIKKSTWVADLAPCPFCGNAPKLKVACVPSKQDKDIKVMLSIECKHENVWCNAGFGTIGRRCSFETYRNQSDVPESIVSFLKTTWNRRAADHSINSETGLRPCPFCGGQPHQTKSNNKWGMKPKIECHCIGVVSVHANSDAENVKLWNNRGGKAEDIQAGKKGFFSRLFG